jgi:cysteinyl-tRNA synthetase
VGVVEDQFKNEFIKCISDDFNTAQALAIAFDLLKSNLSNENKLATILDFDKVLGLDLNLTEKIKIKIPPEIEKILYERDLARKEKDWGRADELRKELNIQGYEVKDTDKGQEISSL